jgi:DNA polymerase-3 subunit alpha
METPESNKDAAPDLKPLSEHDTLAYEREVLGFYFSGHPLLGIKAQLKACATHEIAQLSAAITTPVRISGMVSRLRKMVSKKTGEPWVICTLEDLTGEITLLCFPKIYATGLAHIAKVGSFVAASGRLTFRGEEAEGNSAEMIVDEMTPLDLAVSRFAKRLYLKCDATVGTEKLQALRDLFEIHGGPCPIVLEQETPEGIAVLEIEYSVALNQKLFDAIEALLGPHSWRIDVGAAPAFIPRGPAKRNFRGS